MKGTGSNTSSILHMVAVLVLLAAPLLAVTGVSSQASSQTTDKATQPRPSTAKKLPTNHTTIVVRAHLTPEEKEEGKLNEAFQPLYILRKTEDCPAAIEKYRSVIIPMAQKAKFSNPRNKYLFLSYQGIGNCDLRLKKFAQAEKALQKALKYLQVWPGVNDSDYPAIFLWIGLAREGRQDWGGAEESLKKSVSIYDGQIDAKVLSKPSIEEAESADYLRRSEDSAMVALATVYYRELHTKDALALLDEAYVQASRDGSSQSRVEQIIYVALGISEATHDRAAEANWLHRATDLK